MARRATTNVAPLPPSTPACEAELAARWAAGVWRGATLQTLSGATYRLIFEGRRNGGPVPISATQRSRRKMARGSSAISSCTCAPATGWRMGIIPTRATITSFYTSRSMAPLPPLRSQTEAARRSQH